MTGMAFDRTQQYRNRGGPGGNAAADPTDFQQNLIDFDLDDEESVDDPDDFGICAALSVMYLQRRNQGGNREGGLARIQLLEGQTDDAVAHQLAGEARERAARQGGLDKTTQVTQQLQEIGRRCMLFVDLLNHVPSGDHATVVVNVLPRGAYLLDYQTTPGEEDSHTIAVYSTPNTVYIFDANCGEMRCPRNQSAQMWQDYWADVADVGWTVSNVRIYGCVGARTGLNMAVSIALTVLHPAYQQQGQLLQQVAPGMVPFGVRTFQLLPH
jgi:hypothetical protein